ncbi:hypothetical protein EDC04DRAFT_2809988 [Pisolithus marmoratus]|nr:hypothetical protein EDC04DRAFT_2809988 [Pisolithus marmoratus]
MNRLLPGRYHITSLENNEYLGVSFFAEVILFSHEPPSPSRFGEFTVVPVGNGETDTYAFVIYNHTVRGQNDRIFAFQHKPAEEWVIHYREFHNAYTIERREGSLAWTTPREPPGQFEVRQILLCPLIVTHSVSLQFLPSQLFRFEHVCME